MPATARFTADLYDRLGLTTTADARTIRQQFRRMARLLHPDRNPAPLAHERFLAVQAAYDLLNDPQMRPEYDHWLAAQGPLARPLEMEVRLGPASLRTDVDRQRLYLLVSITTTLDPAAFETPLNLVLLLDCSSSMRGEWLQQSKQATAAIAAQLGPRDILSVASFNDRATVLLPPQRGPQRYAVRGALDGLEASGGTEIAAALELALEQIRRHARADVLSHLILLTDGQTYGDEARALELAHRAGAAQIGLTVLGLGSDWNDEFLDELAAHAYGQAHHIAEPNQAVSIFECHLRQLQQTVARRASLAFEPGPGVGLLDLHEVAPELRRLTLQEGAVALGPLPGGAAFQLLIDLVVSPGDRDLLLIGDLTLEALLRHDGRTVHLQHPIIATREGATEHVPAEVVAASQRIAMLRLQERAWHSVATGNTAGARRELSLLATRLIEMGEVELAHATRRELDAIAATGQLSPDGSKRIKYGSRKLGLARIPGEGA